MDALCKTCWESVPHDLNMIACFCYLRIPMSRGWSSRSTAWLLHRKQESTESLEMSSCCALSGRKGLKLFWRVRGTALRDLCQRCGSKFLFGQEEKCSDYLQGYHGLFRQECAKAGDLLSCAFIKEASVPARIQPWGIYHDVRMPVALFSGRCMHGASMPAALLIILCPFILAWPWQAMGGWEWMVFPEFVLSMCAPVTSVLLTCSILPAWPQQFTSNSCHCLRKRGRGMFVHITLPVMVHLNISSDHSREDAWLHLSFSGRNNCFGRCAVGVCLPVALLIMIFPTIALVSSFLYYRSALSLAIVCSVLTFQQSMFCVEACLRPCGWYFFSESLCSYLSCYLSCTISHPSCSDSAALLSFFCIFLPYIWSFVVAQGHSMCLRLFHIFGCSVCLRLFRIYFQVNTWNAWLLTIDDELVLWHEIAMYGRFFCSVSYWISNE